MFFPTISSRAIGLATLLALATATTAAVAEPARAPARARKSPPPAPAICPAVDVPAGTAAMLVARDPESGGLRPPTAEEAALLHEGLARLMSRSTDGLKVVTKEDGSKLVNLEGRFLDLSVARRGPGGRVVEGCFDDPRAAADFLTRPPAPAPALEEK